MEPPHPYESQIWISNDANCSEDNELRVLNIVYQQEAAVATVE